MLSLRTEKEKGAAGLSPGSRGKGTAGEALSRGYSHGRLVYGGTGKKLKINFCQRFGKKKKGFTFALPKRRKA